MGRLRTALHLCVPQVYLQTWGTQATRYRDIQDAYLDRLPPLREAAKLGRVNFNRMGTAIHKGLLEGLTSNSMGFAEIVTDDPLREPMDPATRRTIWEWYLGRMPGGLQTKLGAIPYTWQEPQTQARERAQARICQRCAGMGWDEGYPCLKCLWACQACADKPSPRDCKACDGHGLTFSNGLSIGRTPRQVSRGHIPDLCPHCGRRLAEAFGLALDSVTGLRCGQCDGPIHRVLDP